MTVRHAESPLPLVAVMNLAAVILGAVFLSLFLNRLILTGSFASLPAAGAPSGGSPEQTAIKAPVVHKKNRLSLTLILHAFSGMFLLLFINRLIPPLLSLNFSLFFILTIAACLLLAWFFMVFLIASYLIVKDQAGLGGYVKTLGKAILYPLKPVSAFALFYGSSLIFLLLSVLVFKFLGVFFNNTSVSSFLAVFYRDALTACMAGGLFILFFKLLHFHLTAAGFEPESEPSVTNTRPLFAYVLLGCFFIGTIINSFPSKISLFDLINRQISQTTQNAETYRQNDRLYLCGVEYDKAYALTQAYKGCLYSFQLQENSKLSDSAKSELSSKMDLAFKTAYEFWPNSAVICYLDAVRQMEKNINSSIALLEKASVLDPDFRDAQFLLLELYAQNKADEKTGPVCESLIRSGAYVHTISSGAMSTKKISDNLEKNTAVEKLCLENMTTKAVFYYENQLYKEAMDELTRISQVLPNDLAVNYLIAVTDLEIKSDGKKYNDAIQASQRILEQYPGEDWAQDFATTIAMRANNQEILEGSLQNSYQKNPGNADIAEQYAYSLLKNNSNFSYTDYAKQAEVIIDGVLEQSDDRWFAFYCKSVIELLKREYEPSLSHFTKFSDILIDEPQLHAIYDDLYNLYVLKYAYLMMTDQNAKTAFAAQEQVNPFLFNYVTGVYCWRSSDYDNGPQYLMEAINLSPGFSKPHYILGNIYFEHATVSQLPEFFAPAEEQYRKSLAIFPEDPYAWFSLGHVLKKTNRLQEAIGAFQQALVNMPAEDHNTDHFGISIHSTYQIEEIKQTLRDRGVQ